MKLEKLNPFQRKTNFFSKYHENIYIFVVLSTIWKPKGVFTLAGGDWVFSVSSGN
jgi:hypothetical protein